ncbi:alanine racemase [bacterium]|nr:MAG: alanine racemase [bacterium]
MTPLPKGRPTFCSIDLEALRWNFRQVRKKVGRPVKVLSVVKANAYGHGAVQVARALEDEGSYGFGVATLEEGIELRKGGLQSPVLILAGIYPEQIEELLEYHLTPTICEVEALRLLERLARKRGVSLPFHLKVDTGMGRLGFLPSEIDSWMPELAGIKALKLEGVFSNFSQAERADGDYTQGQVETFKNVVKGLKAQGHHPRLVHLANSAAVIALPSSYFTMVRPGLVLYGIYPSRDMARRLSLKPVLTWKTRILQLKRVPKGAGISYGRTFVTKRESLIAVLPVGYADGCHRLLSNRGTVLVRGKRAPIVGRICMDLTMIDVTDIRGVKQGDEVVLLGKQGADRISADEMARWAETISYEILTSISARVPRIHHSSKEE